MGAYVDPPDQDKQRWLEENGERIKEKEAKRIANNFGNGATSKLPVCLVDNGPFMAAGIVWSQREFQAFSRRRDARPKIWYKADLEDLLGVSGELEMYLEGTDWWEKES